MNEKMDLILFAGGYAGSLRPITEYIPKAMLPLGNKPIIQRVLEQVLPNCPIKKIYVAANYYHELIFEYLKLLKMANVIRNELIFLNTNIADYDTGGVLLDIEQEISDNFIIYYTDVLPISMDYQALINTHFKKQENNMIGTLATSYYYNLETGYVDLDTRGYITSFIEKPEKDDKLKNMAIGIFKSAIIKYVNLRKDNLFRDVVPSALKDGMLFQSYIHNAQWYHFQHINKYHSEHVLNYTNWI